MIFLPEQKRKDNVFYLSDDKSYKVKEDIYLDVREKEGRIYPDEIVKSLPDISKDHVHYNEWKVRKKSSAELIKYFSGFSGKNILDLGCGNGWLSNLISSKTENFVFAVDLNERELKQGAGIFAGNPRLKFIYGNIFEDILPAGEFDFIIIASAVQYFEDLNSLLKRLFHFILPTGEIHIIDSNFYNQQELSAAGLRTGRYYKSLSTPEMISFYHHHSWNELDDFKYKIINKTKFNWRRGFTEIGFSMLHVFPHIKIIL